MANLVFFEEKYIFFFSPSAFNTVVTFLILCGCGFLRWFEKHKMKRIQTWTLRERPVFFFCGYSMCFALCLSSNSFLLFFQFSNFCSALSFPSFQFSKMIFFNVFSFRGTKGKVCGNSVSFFNYYTLLMQQKYLRS